MHTVINMKGTYYTMRRTQPTITRMFSTICNYFFPVPECRRQHSCFPLPLASWRSEVLLIPLERIQKKGRTIHYDTGIQTYTAGWKGLTMMY
jgi:hypothetical protein